MGLPPDEGTSAHVEAVYPGQCTVSVEHDKGVMEAGLFRFLRFSLGLEGEVKDLLDDRQGSFDWDACYQFAKRQTLVGVLFGGIQRLPKELAPARPLLLRWLSDSESIRRRNMRMDRASAYIYNKVCAAGFRCCILKGQGNALLYPHPSSRTPGDVDVWVMANREELRHIALSLTEGDGSSLQESLNHMGLTVHGVSAELHSTPALLNSPLHNSRLQKWLKRNADLQCSNRIALPNNAGEVAVPTVSFNIIYQLCHLFHHCFYEGVGLRQIVDYFFVLKNTDFSGNTNGASGNTDCFSGNTDCDGVLSNTDFTDNTDRIGGNAESDGSLMNTDCTDFTDSSSGGVVEVDSGGSLVALQEELKWLGLGEFAGAVMYVLREVMGLDEKRMICAPDERRGRLLLEEIMAGGNFGHYDTRNHFGQGALWHNIQRFRRDWRMLRFYPSEALSEPLFRAWHFLWRWKQKHIGMPKERNLN